MRLVVVVVVVVEVVNVVEETRDQNVERIGFSFSSMLEHVVWLERHIPQST
jgi:hypothetical protein